jgi:hypothetical protein
MNSTTGAVDLAKNVFELAIAGPDCSLQAANRLCHSFCQVREILHTWA